ncbi:MAG: alpha/beta hydrolase [Chloroflexota bacterium]
MKLIFIPGSGRGKQAWIYQTRYFKDSEAVALPGHPEGKPCSSVDEYADWLHDYIRKKGYKDVVLVGHSLGGAVAQSYTLKYGNELKALVLMGTGARLRVSPAILQTLKDMIGHEAAWRKYVEDEVATLEPEVGKLLVEERVRIGPAVALNDFLCCDKFDVMDRVQNIKLPTLVLCGSQDEMTPTKFSKFLADKIAGAKLVIIEGAPHGVPRDKPKEVNQAIENFLAGVK